MERIEAPPETLSTNLETELCIYGLLLASDVVDGKVVELDLYVVQQSKKKLQQDFDRYVKSMR